MGVRRSRQQYPGVPDIDKFTLGSCQNETVKALEEAAPDIKAPPSMRLKLARLRGCKKTLARLAGVDRPRHSASRAAQRRNR